jgi:fumarylpyruvate hydrolase
VTDYLFDPPEVKTVPVKGEDRLFPVRRIFCVGRNYAAHAAEMGYEVDREAPFYFTKSAQTLTPTGSTVPYPPGTENFHFEMELVIAIGAPVFRAATAEAAKAIYGYACGLDMTRRDLQLKEREKKRPWDLGKDVEGSAVLAPITRASDMAADRPAAHPPRGQRRGEAGRDAGRAGLEGGRDRRGPVEVLSPRARRPDHDRHARGRRPGCRG